MILRLSQTGDKDNIGLSIKTDKLRYMFQVSSLFVNGVEKWYEKLALENAQ